MNNVVFHSPYCLTSSSRLLCFSTVFLRFFSISIFSSSTSSSWSSSSHTSSSSNWKKKIHKSHLVHLCSCTSHVCVKLDSLTQSVGENIGWAAVFIRQHVKIGRETRLCVYLDFWSRHQQRNAPRVFAWQQSNGSLSVLHFAAVNLCINDKCRWRCFRRDSQPLTTDDLPLHRPST